MAGQELETRQKPTPLQELVASLRQPAFREEVKAALPGNVTPQRFVRIAITAVQQNPELVTAERNSVFRSLLACAADGLLPDAREAALVIFTVKGEKKAQYMPMIGGIRKVAGKSGWTISADVVYDGDEFDYWLGENPGLTHKPPKLGTPRGEVIGAYAVANGHGQKLFEVMARDEIERVRSVSRAKNAGPWVDWFEEMCKKTVGRRLFKKLPLRDHDEVSERIVKRMDVDVDLPAIEQSTMTADEANAAASAGAGRSAHGEQQLREEPEVTKDGPTDAQLNRIARLEEKLEADEGPSATAFLKGVFGVEAVQELSPEDAERYEAGLIKAIADRERENVEDADVTEVEEEPETAAEAEPYDFEARAAEVQEKVKKQGRNT